MPVTSMNSTLDQAAKQGLLTPGMSFTQRVWAMCCRIPAGKVATYGGLAKALNKPKAARAVGQALHVNPYAPGVPCHRVVAADGRLNGYAGGLPMKRQLLQDEGVNIEAYRVDLAEHGITLNADDAGS